MSYSNFTDKYAEVSENTSSIGFDGFKKGMSGAKDFLESNSYIAKVAFLLLILILFVVGIQIGSRILMSFLSTKENPIVVKGLKNAKKGIEIKQDPKLNESIPIMRSKDKRDGIELTWNTWLFIEEFEKGKKKHVFHKGSQNFNDNKIAYPNNAPGLYLHETNNSLVVIMNTFDEIKNEVEIPNIPLNKWINVSIRIKHNIMDVYVNNNIASRHIFSSPPKQNYGSVFVNRDGGFPGYISNLRYYGRALSGIEIQKIVSKGPNLRSYEEDLSQFVYPPYFSMRWYFNQKELV